MLAGASKDGGKDGGRDKDAEVGERLYGAIRFFFFFFVLRALAQRIASAVTLAELSAGPHEVRPDLTEQDVYFEAAERARRLDVLQRAEHEFDPIPFDADAARAYGRATAAVVAAGRKPRRRAVDLMIAATAIAAELPLYTTNPGDFVGLDHLVTVVPVTGPEVPNERQSAR